MFGKDKVKGHSRLIKGKLGFKVTRVGDFLRKKDDKDNTARNVVLGVGAISALGIGATLLLKKKGVNITSLKNGLKGATTNTPKYPKGSSVRNKASEMVVDAKATKSFDKLPDPWKSPIPSKYQGRGSKLLVKKEISQNRIRAKEAVTNDPWSTPVKSSIKESTEKVVQETNYIKLLSPAKSRLKPEPRGKLLVPKSNNKVEESVVNMRNTQKNYDTLPLDMKITVQMEKALTRPIKSSNLGRPLDTQGLKVILGDSEKLPIEKVISKAKRKVGDRLKRQNEELVKKNSMT